MVLHNWIQRRPGACFSKFPVTFRARKAVLCLTCLYSRSKFSNFENETMKLSINEAKLTSFELETVLLFNRCWFSNLPSGPKSYPRAFRETGPWSKMSFIGTSRKASIMFIFSSQYICFSILQNWRHHWSITSKKGRGNIVGQLHSFFLSITWKTGITCHR